MMGGNRVEGYPDWRLPAFLIIATAFFIALSFRRTLLELVHTWYASRTYSYGFLILPLFGFLVWTRRKRLLSVVPKPNLWGIPLLAALGLLWLVGNLGEAKVVQEFAVIGMETTAAWLLLGTEVVTVLAFPLAFLFFAVPFGVSLIGPLQDFTAHFAVEALTFTGVPAVLDGRTISLPSEVWTVAEACSGIRYLFSSIVVGTIYASLVYRSRKRKVLFVVAAILVPILANSVRAYGIILLAYLTDNRLAVGVDHIVYGGVFFIVIEMMLLTVGLRWREAPQSRPHEAGKAAEHSAAPANVLVPILKPLPVALIIVAFSGVVPATATRLWQSATAPRDALDLAISIAPPWHAVAAQDSGWTPALHRAEKEYRQAYQSGNSLVDLYTVHYSGQTGAELVSGYNRVENASVWTLTDGGFGVAAVNGRRISVQRTVVESRSVSREVWTWYWVSGEYTANPAAVKLLQAKARLLGRPATAVVITLGLDNQDGIAAERVFQDFLAHASFSATPVVPNS